MRFEEFADWLACAERSFPVADWVVDGVEVWPMVRLNLYHRNFNPVSAGGGRGLRESLSAAGRLPREIVSWARARLLDRASERKLHAPADAVFLAYSAGIQPEIAGRRINPLLAPYVSLLEETGATASVWEASPYGDYNIPRSNPSTLIQPWIRLDRVRSRLADSKEVESRVPGIRDLANLVQASGLRWNYGELSALNADARFVRLLANRFGRALAAVRPSVGFTADYGLPEQAFCLACHERGVLAVEIQHGVQGNTHAAYGMWSALPRGGFRTLPSGYWCWTSEAAQVIDRWTAGAGISPGAFAGGDAWLATWQDSGASLSKRLDSNLATLSAGTTPGIDVLLGLSCVGEVLPPILRKCLATVSTRWRTWARLHPVNQSQQRKMLLRFATELGINDARSEAATLAPLPGLLSRMNVQIVVGPSTLIMQAAQYGVPSVAIGVGSEEAEKLFPAEFASGMIRVASTAEELSQLVTVLSERKRPPARLPVPRAEMVGVMKELISRRGAGLRRVRERPSETLVTESAV